MARNDVYLNINALSPADAVVTGQQDMTAATVPELVLGDTPTFNFYFTDNTNVWPSWAGNASYSLTWALSDAVAGDFAPAATTSVSTPITGGWSVVLPLNSYDLVGLLNTKRVGQPYPVQNLWQQLRVTDPSGNEITRAMFWTPVRYRAISDTQNTESATPTGGRIITTLVSNALQSPTAAQFYAANPVPTSALGTAANGELLIGNGTGFTKSTLTAGTGITVTNGSGSITIDASGAQETLTATVKNAESVAITKGQVVYLFGATGGFASVKLAYNTSDATSAKTFGVVSDTSIAANGTGTVTCVGVVDGLNLGAYNDGDTLYLGATPGSVTATKPYAPNHLVYVGIVERANAGNGELYVRVQNGYELDEIHDVQINAPKLAGQTLIYDQTNDLWKNARLTGTANQITVTNADAAVTLSIPTNPTLNGNLTVSGAANVANLLTVTGSGTETSVATAKVGASALGGIPRVNLINATNAVNGKYGDIINTAASGNGAFQFRFIDDAITAATAVLSITGRQGATDSFVTAPGTGAHTFGTTNTVTMTNGVLATTGAGTIGGNLTVSGATRVSDGTAAAPSLSFSSDTTKGLYNYGANEVGLAIAGGASLRFATSGIIRGGSVGAQLQLNASTGAIDLTAAGTNKNITLTPSGTGFTVIQGVGSKTSIGDFPLVTSYAALYQGVTTPGNTNYTLASNGQELVINAPSGSSPIRFQVNAEVGRFSTNGNFLIGTTSDGGQKLQVSGTAAITGAISIGNTVNTVSPTSPNRTITIVIGGTTYYIHAKTTND